MDQFVVLFQRRYIVTLGLRSIAAIGNVLRHLGILHVSTAYSPQLIGQAEKTIQNRLPAS